MRPSDRSWSVAYELARTVGSRVAGFVTKWPSLIVEVSRAATASIGIDSCQRTCESYVHAYPKPCFSASWMSSSQRENGGSGRTVTPKSIARAYRDCPRGACPVSDTGHALHSRVGTRYRHGRSGHVNGTRNCATTRTRSCGHVSSSHVGTSHVGTWY